VGGDDVPSQVKEASSTAEARLAETAANLERERCLREASEASCTAMEEARLTMDQLLLKTRKESQEKTAGLEAKLEEQRRVSGEEYGACRNQLCELIDSKEGLEEALRHNAARFEEKEGEIEALVHLIAVLEKRLSQAQASAEIMATAAVEAAGQAQSELARRTEHQAGSQTAGRLPPY